MGSAPQQPSSVFSQVANSSSPMAPWLTASLGAPEISGAIQQATQAAQQQGSLPSGMAPPAQPQSTPAAPAAAPASQPQSNMAPITQQLQQAVQPGSSANTYTQQQNPLSQILGGWGNRYG